MEGEKVAKGKPLTPTSGLSSGSLGTLQEQHMRESVKGVQTRSSSGSAAGVAGVPSSRWSGSKKDGLTKEEMERINNCNPS